MDRSDQRQWGAKEVARLLTLVESERRYYQEILAIQPVPVAVIDAELRLISTNKAFRALFGLSREDAPDKLEAGGPIEHELNHALLNRQVSLDFPCTLFDKHILASIAPLNSWEEGREAVLTVAAAPSIAALTAPVAIPDQIVEAPVVAETVVPEAVVEEIKPEPVALVEEHSETAPVEEIQPEPELREMTLPIPVFAWEIDAEGARQSLLSPEDGIAASLRDITCGAPFEDWLPYVHPEEQASVQQFYTLITHRGGRGSCEYRMAMGNSWSLVRDSVEVTVDGICRGVSFDLTRHYQGLQPGLETLRRETAGQLARSVTHELNNTLMIIQGYAEELHHGFTENDTRRQDTQELVKATARAAATVAKLQSYYRPATPKVQVFDLHSLVEGIAETHPRIFERVELELQAGHPNIEFDAVLLQNWLSQLVQDTVTHNPEAVVSVSTRLIVWKDRVGFPGAPMPGDYVALRVSVSPAPTARIGSLSTLDFSSEAAAVHALAVSSAGCMWLVSPWDPNGVFQLWLPKSSGIVEAIPTPVVVAEPVAPPVVERKIRKRKALVVEDEEGIRSLERRLLERQGFEVVEASNGREALDWVAAQAGESLDLLVTDWYMPGMTGMELIESMRKTYPEVPALLVSGYADDAAVQAGTMPHRMQFLQKPFTLNSLAEAVETLLQK